MQTTKPCSTDAAPPRWLAAECSVGEPGLPGCRRCVEACPYQALRAVDRPGGTVIDIDSDLCRRCGACTGVCPVSALERSFAPDAEIRRAIDAAIGVIGNGGTIVFTCTSGRDRIMATANLSNLYFLTLPSLLILNETHLLYALRTGASRVLLAGCPDCHHNRTDLLELSIRLVESFTGNESRAVFVEEIDVASVLSLWRANPSTVGTSSLPSIPVRASRRDVLNALMGDSIAPFEEPRSPFADVAVHDEACTLCGACAQVCRSGALTHNQANADLSFRQADCINCGLCAAACPANAVEVKPGLSSLDGFQERRVLVSDQPVHCAECGRPYMAARLYEQARNLLAATGSLREPHAQIELCGNCRRVTQDAPQREVDRRTFLGASAAAAFTALGSAHADTSLPRTARLGMVIDLDRCIGCHACTAACKAENDVPLGVFRDWVEEHVLGTYPHAVPTFLPKLCNHCENPGCMRACPTGAIYKRSDGIVELDHDLCIGCRACNQACPYGAAYMDPVRGTADKCNLCSHRVDAGLNPACVDVCPTRCRIFGDLDNPESAPSQAIRHGTPSVLRAELGLEPNVVYLGLDGKLNR